MPDIHIVRRHGATLARAKELAQQAADDLAREYDLVTRWVGNTLHFQRSGVQGAMHVDHERIDLEVTLGFLLKAFRASFVKHIEREFDTLLTKDADRPAAKPSPKKDASAAKAAAKSDGSAAKAAAKRPARKAAGDR